MIRPINKPLNYPVIFYSPNGAYTPLGYAMKNTIKKPVESEPEKKKKYKYFQKNIK